MTTFFKCDIGVQEQLATHFQVTGAFDILKDLTNEESIWIACECALELEWYLGCEPHVTTYSSCKASVGKVV